MGGGGIMDIRDKNKRWVRRFLQFIIAFSSIDLRLRVVPIVYELILACKVGDVGFLKSIGVQVFFT